MSFSVPMSGAWPAISQSGIEEARLIRNLDMVEFSFGFSRVSATPETVQKDRHMPVRLMGFPPLPSNKRPIYVIEQQNEAIYIQLDAEMVGAFLQSNGVWISRHRRHERLEGD